MDFIEHSSKRLLFIKPSIKHAEDLFLLRSNEIVNHYIQRNAPTKIEDVHIFIDTLITNIQNNESYYWCILEKNQSKTIGTICLWNFTNDRKTAEIGYELNPDYHGKGLMSEAMETILKFGFNKLNLKNIEAFTHVANQSSIKLLLKHGFIRNENRKDADNLNNIIFELEKENNLL